MSRQDGENARRPSASPLTYRRESETLDVDVTATGQSQEGEEGGLRSDLRIVCTVSCLQNDKQVFRRHVLKYGDV